MVHSAVYCAVLRCWVKPLTRLNSSTVWLVGLGCCQSALYVLHRCLGGLHI